MNDMAKNLILWVVIAIVLLSVFNNFSAHTSTQRIPYSRFVEQVENGEVDQVVIDLSQVAFLDSAALGLLMISHRQLQAEKRTLSLAYPHPTVRQILELANLHKTIPLIDADVPAMAKKSA